MVNILRISKDIPFSNFGSEDDKFPSQRIPSEHADASLLFTTVGAVIFTTLECSVGERPGVSCEQEREKKGG